MKYDVERFQLVDINDKEIVGKFGTSNRRYLLDAKSFARKHKPGDHEYEIVFRVIKPVIDDFSVNFKDIRIGNIKKGSASRIKNLLADANYSHSEVEIGGGRYQTLDLDGNGNLTVRKGSSRFWANLVVYLKK